MACGSASVTCDHMRISIISCVSSILFSSSIILSNRVLFDLSILKHVCHIITDPQSRLSILGSQVPGLCSHASPRSHVSISTNSYDLSLLGS